jgi:hypothetical protein
MPRPYVSAVTFIEKQIVLTIQLDEYLAGQPVEISGYATQNNGAFANFYAIQSVGANPDGTVVMYVKGTPQTPFMEGEPVTVTLRAAKVWVTVLTGDGEISPQSQPAKATDGTTWNNAIKEVWASGGPSSSWSAGQAGDSSFPGS